MHEPLTNRLHRGLDHAKRSKHFMKTRPRIKLRLTITDKIFEIIGWSALVASWGMIIICYPKLPDIIPTHYNLIGHVDGFGEKDSILILPVIATIFFIGMTLLNKFPHIFNYPTIITENNALRQYTIATRLIRYLKFAFVLLFGLIAFTSIQNANGQNGLSGLFFPLTIGFIFLPLVYFMRKLYKEK